MSQHTFYKGEIVHILGIMGHFLCLSYLKAAIHIMRMNENGCVPISFTKNRKHTEIGPWVLVADLSDLLTLA